MTLATQKEMIEDGWRNLHVGDQVFHRRTKGPTQHIIPSEGKDKFFTQEQIDSIVKVYGEPTKTHTTYNHTTKRDGVTELEYTL